MKMDIRAFGWDCPDIPDTRSKLIRESTCCYQPDGIGYQKCGHDVSVINLAPSHFFGNLGFQ